MKEGPKSQKYPTEFMDLWNSPGHSEGATSQHSAHQGVMYLALACPKPKEKLWYSEAGISCAMRFNVGLKTEGKERGKEVWVFERCSLVFLSLSPINVCGDLLLMDDLRAYSKCCLLFIFLGKQDDMGIIRCGC